MIVAILVGLAIYWLLLSLFAYYYVKKIFRKYKDYPRIELAPHIQSSVRMDFGKWDEKEIIKGCFLRFAFHFTTLLSFLFIYGLIATFQKYLKYPKSIIDFYRINVGRFAFKVCFDLKEEFDYKEKITTPIVSSNHVCWADFIYMGSSLPLVSFVAKSDIEELPIISSIAKYIRTLYVDRSNPNNRQKIKQDILERVNRYQNNPQSQEIPLVIYPEGSCTNGRSIMNFNNGAFQALSPITLFSLKYESKWFHLGLEELSNDAHAIITFCLKPSLLVKKEVVSALKDETVEEYRERCRSKLSAMTGFPTFNCSFKEQMEYLYKIEAIIKERRAKRA